MPGLNQKLLEHFLNPRNVGTLENPDGYASVENPVNGYRTDIYIQVKNRQIQDIKFKTVGCTATIAVASALTELVKGKTLDEILDSGNPLGILLESIKSELEEIPDKNWHCPPTAIQTLLTAILDYYMKKGEEKNIKKIEKALFDLKSYFEARLKE